MRGMPEGGEGDTCRGSTPYQAAVERRHPCRGEPDGALQAVPFRDHGAGGRQMGTPMPNHGNKHRCPNKGSSVLGDFRAVLKNLLA